MTFQAFDDDRRAGGLGPVSPIGKVLLRRGAASARKLAHAESRSIRQDERLSDGIRIKLSLPARIVAEAEAELAGTGFIDPIATPPDARLMARLKPEVLLRLGVLPWRTIAGQTIVLTTHPDRFSHARDMLTAVYGPVRMSMTTTDLLHRMVRQISDVTLIKKAENLVADSESCRGWDVALARRIGLALICAVAAGLLVAPGVVYAALSLWAIVTLISSIALKLSALVLALRHRAKTTEITTNVQPIRLPVVTVFVPLFQEQEIASHLINRLSAIDYPHELLDICLLLEADDLTTQTALKETNLPRWMRAIIVPRGTLKTKPRALNFGLTFARGSIIGIYDAEDQPAPDQIRQVVATFGASPHDVACLQGVLDFYNSGTNWLSRCFTVEYASWFRVILPGLAKMGLVVPLGGTTLFLRRSVIEELGGWDAHNVTEDADLGLRLARHGYRTELIATVTQEEANCRAWPWVKQRSRWLKGYAITYAVHMRNPRKLWADLGAKSFWGVQVLFLGTLSQFALAPVLWSFWLVPFGLQHPLQPLLSDLGFLLLGAVFITAEMLNMVIAAVAVNRAGKPWLVKWVPSLTLYFPLAALASYKGLWELFTRPFYWDKTAHGVHLPKAGD